MTLSPIFALSELKRAYRKLAKSLHPDLNPQISSEDFQNMQADYKLLKNANGNDEFYDLNNDPYEQSNLLSGTLTTTENSIKTELETELNNIRN